MSDASFQFRALVGAAIVASFAGVASAGFVTPVAPSWNGAADTTSQAWSPMTSSATVPTAVSPQSPTAPSSNPNGMAGWYDSSASTDGAFVIGSPGGDVYSFSGVITPTVTIPGYNLSGNVLNVFVEAQSYGGIVNTSDLTATYTDQTGQHSILVSTLPSYQYTQVYNDGGANFGGLGTAYMIDGQWTFTLANDASNLQLSWGWDAESSAIQDLAIFTQSTAVSAPSGSAWTGAADTTWANSGNWTGSEPGATSDTSNTDTALFNHAAANSPLKIDAGRNLMNITFDTASVGSMTVGTTGGNALTLTSGGTIAVTSTVMRPQVVNAPLMLEGNYTFANSSTTSGATLSFGGAIAPDPALSGLTTLTLGGFNTGANTISGALADGGPVAPLAVSVSGSGVWVFSGSAKTYSGGTAVAAGATLELAGSTSQLSPLQNVSNSGSLVIAGSANQNVGTVSGTGSVAVAAGASLTANQILQDSLIIGAGATVTIASSGSGSLAATDPNTNQGLDTSRLESRVVGLIPSSSLWSSSGTSPIAETGGGLFIADSSQFAADSDSTSGGTEFAFGSSVVGSAAAVPEPATLFLAALAGICLVLAARRRIIAAVHSWRRVA